MQKIGLVGIELRNKFCDLFHKEKNSKTQSWGIVVYENGKVRED